MQRKSRSLLIILILLNSSCFSTINNMNKEDIKDFNGYNDYLYEIRSNLNLDTVKQAKKYAESITDQTQSIHALMELKKNVSKYGDKESKLYYSLGSDLKINLLKVNLTLEDIDYLNNFSNSEQCLNINTLRKLDIVEKNKIKEIINKSTNHYGKLVSAKSSSNSLERMIFDSIKEFILYLDI